jgi:8-oxo-dGTP pyrophosphatase MutT (NUDIX family)
LTAAEVEGGWLEFDTPRDLGLARGLLGVPRPEVFDYSCLWKHPSVISSGGVAVRGTGSDQAVLLVGTGQAGAWRIPKGMLVPGESLRAGACREVAEETGIDVVVDGFAGSEEWTYAFDGRQWHEKCYFYRMIAKHEGVPRPDAENAVAAWVGTATAITGMQY